jgi:hypothetical protein
VKFSRFINKRRIETSTCRLCLIPFKFGEIPTRRCQRGKGRRTVTAARATKRRKAGETGKDMKGVGKGWEEESFPRRLWWLMHHKGKFSCHANLTGGIFGALVYSP